MKLQTSAFILLPSSFGMLAARLGFEPRQSDSESLVLPLHYVAKSAWETRDGENTDRAGEGKAKF